MPSGNRASDGSSKTLDRHGVVLGNLALQRGWITTDQLREALTEQSRVFGTDDNPRTLGSVLVECGFLTSDQVAEILAEQKKARKESREFRSSLKATPPPPPPQEPPSRATETFRTFGRYTIVRPVGQGGMAEVYEALDPQLERRVALKIMKSHSDSDPKQAAADNERFLREAKLSANLPKHAHIVGVYEAGVVDGRRYLAAEFIQGEPLDDWRSRTDPSLRAQISLLHDVAEAVHHAHTHGIVHRDLKPQNILVDTKRRPHVTDFGLAKAIRHDTNVSLTGAGMTVGTPAYMSPEQAQGSKTADARADVYSLGVMLYEMLTNETPFKGDTAVEIIVKAARDPVPSPSTVLRSAGKRVDRALEKICLRALARNPEDRFPTAQAFALSLAQWLKGGQVSPGGSKRKMIALAAVAAAALIALTIAMLRPSDVPPVATTNTTPPPAPDAPPAAPEGMEYAGRNGQDHHEFRNLRDDSTMILIPAGSFLMGSDEDQDSEKPRHSVELSAYLIDKTEITVGQFRRFVEATGHQTATDRGKTATVIKKGKKTPDPDASWTSPGYPQEDDHPVTCINWSDARAYCKWAGKRLPTEAEWERAARGTDGRRFPWGNDATSSRANAGGTRRTYAVGSFPKGASPCGALDMAGNVSEFCQDRFDSAYFRSLPRTDPKGPSEGKGRILKGGSWYQKRVDSLRSSRRTSGYNPTNLLGVRGVRSYP